MKSSNIVDEWIEEGIAKRLPEAVAHAVELAVELAETRGEARAARTTLLRLLQHRFGAVPPSILERIESADAAWCQERTLELLSARSLDDFDWR